MITTLHILPTLNPEAGGLSQAVSSMVRYASGTDLSHEVLSLDREDAPYLRQFAPDVHAIGRGFTAWNYHPKLLSWLSENLKRYDNVIVHGLWQYQSLAVFQAFKKSRDFHGKLLVMPHGMLDPYFQRAADRKLKAARNLAFWKYVEAKLVNAANALLFTCSTEQELARQPFAPYHPRNEQVVGLGVASPPEDRPDLRAAFLNICPQIGDRPYLLYMGRLDRKKGADLLIRAFLKLKAECLPDHVLVIAGPGLDTAYGRELRQMAGEAADIRFTGMLTGDAKWGALYGSEAFVLPSHQENFGIAVVEAMACKKPVLISDQVNIYREIERHKGGMIARDRPDDIYLMLKEWLSLSEEQKSEFARNANRCYQKHYSETTAGRLMRNVLKQERL